MVSEKSQMEIDRLTKNIEKLFERDADQTAIINRLNLIIAGDNNAGIKGLVQTQAEMKEELNKLNSIVIGGKAIGWILGAVGIGGIIMAAKMVTVLAEISEHIIK